MEPLGLTYNIKTRRNYLFLAVAVSLLCMGLFLWIPASLAGVGGILFIGLFFSSRTFRWTVFPAVLIFNQFLIRNTGVPYIIGGLAVQPIDWIAILLILTVILEQILTGSRFQVRTGLEKPIGIFLAALAVSFLNVSDLRAGFINWGHTALYFLAFYAMVFDWRDVPLERIWRAYFFCALLAALSALWQFFASGGGRSLGLAGIPLNHLIIPVLCFELSRLFLGEKNGRWWVVAVFAVTSVATQTRGVWLGVATLLIVWLFSGSFLQPMTRVVTKRFARKVLGALLVLLLLFYVLAPLLSQVEQRAEQLAQHSGTVYLRLFLWGVALQFFVEHPIVGIGMGQLAGAMGQFPEMKNLAVFTWTHGLSAHNILLTFLAETGVVGTCGFLILLVATVRFAWKCVRDVRTLEELGWGWSFFMIFSVFAISFLFAGSWDYTFVFFLALMALFFQKRQIRAELADGR